MAPPIFPTQAAASPPAAAGVRVRQAEQRSPREEGTLVLGRAYTGDNAHAAAPGGVRRRAWHGRRTTFAIERAGKGQRRRDRLRRASTGGG
uniref:Uncharacterized protein n=1 Tax=Oryza brachyantha TaxID=4533 RepID=J3MLK9_ORYBR